MTIQQIRELAQIEWGRYLASVAHVPRSKRMNWVTWIRGVEWLYEGHMRKLLEVDATVVSHHTIPNYPYVLLADFEELQAERDRLKADLGLEKKENERAKADYDERDRHAKEFCRLYNASLDTIVALKQELHRHGLGEEPGDY